MKDFDEMLKFADFPITLSLRFLFAFYDFFIKYYISALFYEHTYYVNRRISNSKSTTQDKGIFYDNQSFIQNFPEHIFPYYWGYYTES